MASPHAPSNRHTNPQSVYRKHEQIKKRIYEQRIREIEHATSALHYRRPSKRGHYHLHVCVQVGPNLQHPALATLPSSLLPSTLLHPGHQRCKIIVWTCHQNAHDGRPDYNSESHLTSLYIAFVYFLFLPAFILFLVTNCICFLLKKRFLLQSTPATQRLLSSGNDWVERKFISLPNS